VQVALDLGIDVPLAIVTGADVSPQWAQGPPARRLVAKARRGELAMPLPVGFVHDPPTGWSWTPTWACSRPCATCFRPSPAPAQPVPPSRPSRRRACCSRCGCAPGPTAASSAGIGWPITASCRCCTTHAMQARSHMGAAAHGAAPTGRPATCCNPARTGSRSSPTRTPAISAGEQFEQTSAAWRPARQPTGKTAAQARPRKARPCCRDWWSGDAAGNA
jgi:hypothetical protein